MLRLAPILALGFSLVAISISHSQSAASQMEEAAQNLLKSLSDEQKGKCLFEWSSDERLNWHYIPKDRSGLLLKEMTDAQRNLAHALLSTGLSSSGVTRALNVMTLEQVLFEKEDQNPTRDPGKYYFSIFGNPNPKSPWGWRVEGHHLSLNFVVAQGKVLSSTPSFFASNPAKVLKGPHKGWRVLAPVEDHARKLVKSLSEAQKESAIFSDEAPREILTAAERKVGKLEPRGISYAELNAKQKKQLKSLIKAYLNRHHANIASQEMSRIEDIGYNALSFAWAGGIEMGDPHYYRVQGEHFLLEYANTQNDANHVHSVWRDFDNDFGSDVLAKHFKEEH